MNTWQDHLFDQLKGVKDIGIIIVSMLPNGLYKMNNAMWKRNARIMEMKIYNYNSQFLTKEQLASPHVPEGH